MRESSVIRKKRIAWDKYQATKLDLEKRRKYSPNSYISCGSAALGLITGISPKIVEQSCPNPKVGWYTSRAIKFLRERGYTVIEISKTDVLKSGGLSFPIKENHCLLMNVRMYDKENTMFVIHKGQLWHNYENEKSYFNNLFFINKPTQDVLLVYKKRWGDNEYEPKKSIFSLWV